MKLGRPAGTGWRKLMIVPNEKLRNLRFYYSGNDRETLTCLRRSMKGPNLCFRMII